MKTNIVVNLQVDGIHFWGKCNIYEVKFLKYEHRHTFHICCKKAVRHDDRDIEIIQFKHQIQQYLHDKYNNVGKRTHYFGGRSCEMLSEELLKAFKLSYCSILEDGENGAEVWAK